jgi:hypothetical protein
MPPREPREPHRGGVLEFYAMVTPLAALVTLGMALGLDRHGAHVAGGLRDVAGGLRDAANASVAARSFERAAGGITDIGDAVREGVTFKYGLFSG